MDKPMILKIMSEIVENTMTSFKSDFYKYDTQHILEHDDAPILWIVGPSNTSLINIAEYAKDYQNGKESVIYDWHRPTGSVFHIYLTPLMVTDNKARVFIISNTDVREYTAEEALGCIENYMKPITISFTDNYKVRVRLKNITLKRLKELIQESWEHNDNSLMNCLKRFHQYSKSSKDHTIDVWYDPNYNEFCFHERVNGRTGLVGGIIFHGWSETGYKENYSVQLCPSYGWSIHT